MIAAKKKKHSGSHLNLGAADLCEADLRGAELSGEKLRVWFAPEDMQGGRKFIEQIDRVIQVNDRLLLVLSEQSMNSEWVRREVKASGS